MFAGRNMTFARPYDSDAALRIADIKAAGGTVSPAQEFSLHVFFSTAKAAGYYTSLKRLYLPIWGVAAANAIDLITGASGTFNGGVTHGAGFVQGDGTTGYFDMGVDPTTIGMATDSFFLGFGNYTAGSNSQRMIGSGESDAQQIYLNRGLSTTGGYAFTTVVTSLTGTPHTGIYVLSKLEGSDARNVSCRKSTGVTQSSGATVLGSVPAINIFSMAFNNNGAASNFTSARMFSFFAGLYMTISQRNAFTLNLKALWETTTGLTLP